MDNLSLPHQFILDFKSSLLNGVSVNDSIENYLAKNSCEFSKSLTFWWISSNQFDSTCKNNFYTENTYKLTPHRVALFKLLDIGLSGGSILPALTELETEISTEEEMQMDRFLKTLAFKSLLPLLFLLFPAYLIILLGPLILSLLKGISI